MEMYNNSMSDTSWNSPYSVTVQIIVWLIIVILSLETIIGNAMVVLAYKLERNISKQVSNRYIVSLAISDLIIGIEGFPLFTVYVLNGERWPLGGIACETWLFLDYTLCLVSILTVLLITADRYLSVCHTAKYLKWQSPTKTQALIILSWLIPAIIFGIMIYGWNTMTGETESMSGAECSAPFLTNPYVNMGMYVAYYWTTLVAMLILYKGIHQAAKNLEKKAKAKERRHIALILSQRLGTQVGVSLMLQSRAEKEKAEEKNKDSGYNTNTVGFPPLQQKGGIRRFGFAEPETSTFRTDPNDENRFGIEGSGNTDSEQNLGIIEEEKSGMFTRRESNESYFPVPCPTAANSRRCSEMEKISLGSHPIEEPVIVSLKRNTNRLSLRSNGSRYSVSEHPIAEDEPRERTDSLRELFNDDDLGSVLNFKGETLNRMNSINESDTTSVIISHRSSSKRYKTKSHTPRTSSRISRRSNRGSKTIPNVAEIEECVPGTSGVNHPLPKPEQKRAGNEHWVHSMRKRIAQVLSRKKVERQEPDRRSCSSSDEWESSERKLSNVDLSDSSTEAEVNPAPAAEKPTKLTVPQLTISEDPKEECETLAVPTTAKSDTLLSATGMSRKLSAFSTSITREKVISSIFAPISVFNRGRKQTKAEKRAHKAFRTITFIVGFFAILWSPYYIMATVYGFCKGQCIPSFLYTLSYYMCYLNSSGNPFAYALANRQFRSAFMRMFRGNFNKIA